MVEGLVVARGAPQRGRACQQLDKVAAESELASRDLPVILASLCPATAAAAAAAPALLCVPACGDTERAKHANLHADATKAGPAERAGWRTRPLPSVNAERGPQVSGCTAPPRSSSCWLLYGIITKGLAKKISPCSAQAGRGARLPPAWRGPRTPLPAPRRACALQGGGRLCQPLCGGP